MTALSDRLGEKTSAIAERWLADALAAYPADSAALFRQQKDRFANPVGHALRVGTRAAVEALLEGREAEEICTHLDEIVKIRAVQEFHPSQAVSFVFQLKGAIRAALGTEGPSTQGPSEVLSSELADLERRIDLMALGVFDIYMRYRGQVYELRINEVKRSVARVMETMGRRRSPPSSNEDGLEPGPLEAGPLERDEAQRGGGQ